MVRGSASVAADPRYCVIALEPVTKIGRIVQDHATKDPRAPLLMCRTPRRITVNRTVGHGCVGYRCMRYSNTHKPTTTPDCHS